MEKFKSINWGFTIAIIFWCAITLIRVFYHSPWYDESHAWTIAKELNLIEIFQFMRTEGHTFLWYLVLMPFAKNDFMYPYSMLLLNWFFCLVALVILWLKAPFNNWVKFLISFSFPFLGLYSVIARCYSIGIMFLFILISIDKIKLRHPNWYATLLILLANTSLMGTIPATVLGVRFACEMVKNKQKILVPFSIAIFGAVLIILQLFGCVEEGLSIYENRQTIDFVDNIKTVLMQSTAYFEAITIVIALIASIVFYVKNRIVPKFFIFSMLLMAGLFCVYFGRLWHLLFILVYFICSCWLLFDRSDLKYKNLINFALIIVLIPWLIYSPIGKDNNTIWNNLKNLMAKDILLDKNLTNSTVIIFRQFDTVIQPYLEKSNITLVNYCSNELLNHNTMSFYNSKNCSRDFKLDSQLIVLSNEVFDKWYEDEKLYLFTHNKVKLVGEDIKALNLNYNFVLYKDYGLNYLWKVEKIK